MKTHVQVSVPVQSSPYWYQVEANVILDKTISDGAKVLYSLISGLTIKDGYCWASNQYLSEQLGVGESTIKNRLEELCSAGHVQRIVEDNYRRKIYLNYVRGVAKILAGGSQKVGQGVARKLADNITNELDNIISPSANAPAEGLPLKAELNTDITTAPVKKDFTNKFHRYFMDCFKESTGNNYNYSIKGIHALRATLKREPDEKTAVEKLDKYFTLCESKAFGYAPDLSNFISKINVIDIHYQDLKTKGRV